jgi:thiamine-phosphate pyrophosphorylase
VHVPVVAIGGISTRNAKELVAEGVDALAVSSALFNAPNVESEAKSFACLFMQNPDSPTPAT